MCCSVLMVVCCLGEDSVVDSVLRWCSVGCLVCVYVSN